jgi:hypothetical protein
MLVEGYEADGWLGLLLGTSMWYGFYGDAVSQDSVFESRMGSLAREIGGRGRADALCAEPEPIPGTVANGAPAGRATELSGMTMSDALSSAREAGVCEDAIMDAMDDPEPKAALAALVLQSRTSAVADASLRAELEGLRMRELMARAEERGLDREALQNARESEGPKAAVVDLLLAERLREAAAP